MEKEQAFQLSRYIETTIDGTTVIIERFNDIEFLQQCWQYDVYPAGHSRYHKTLYGTIEEVLDIIYENDDYGMIEDGQLEQADWQPTKKTIDTTDCTCRDCIRFCLECQVIPKGMPWHEAMRNRVKWAVEGMLWRVRWNRMRLQEKYGYWR